MDIIMACGTWIGRNPAYGKVIAFVRSCTIFPNVKMIVEATGVTKMQAEYVVGSIFAQERQYISRYFFLAEVEGSPITGITKDEMLICTYFNREEKEKNLADLSAIRSFMDRHRYYDEHGEILHRFNEEQVVKAVNVFIRYQETFKEQKKR